MRKQANKIKNGLLGEIVEGYYFKDVDTHYILSDKTAIVWVKSGSKEEIIQENSFFEIDINTLRDIKP